MIDESDPERDSIHEILQAVGPVGAPDKAVVLTGWVVVAEWMDEAGDKWLSKCHSASLTNWTANGYHHEAVYGAWPEPDED